MTDRRYALIGNNAGHRLWSRIVDRFAQRAGIVFALEPIEASAAGFDACLDDFAAAGGHGASIAAPVEFEATRRCRVLTVTADQAGVVDTLVRQFDDSWLGDNSAGPALLDELVLRRRLDLGERRTLILGGGALSAGILPALIEAGVGDVAVAVHGDHDSAMALSAGLGAPGQINCVDWQSLDDLGAFSLIVHDGVAAPPGALSRLPGRLVSPDAVACDLDCGTFACREFMAWAQAGNAADVFDGLGFQVERVAAALRLWHEHDHDQTDADAVLEQLRGEFDLY